MNFVADESVDRQIVERLRDNGLSCYLSYFRIMTQPPCWWLANGISIIIFKEK